MRAGNILLAALMIIAGILSILGSGASFASWVLAFYVV